MDTFRFWNKLVQITFGKLYRQRLLSVGLLLCVVLPLVIGPVAEDVLSQGVDFSGITLAIVAPEGDPIAGQLEQVLSGMQDISRYCQIKAMDYQQATADLKNGKVSAILVLPPDFVRGVLNGANPNVELLVHKDRPLEAFLTFWVGQSASDMLTAFQTGIYTVLEIYGENPPEGLRYQDVVTRINLRYISWTMNRQDIYHTKMIPVTGNLPIGLHYSLSLFFYLALSLAPAFAKIYDRQWIGSQRRFRAAGRGTGVLYGAALTTCWLIQFLLILLFQVVILRCDITDALLPCLLCGLFCSAFGNVCCLLTDDAGSCGVASFSSTLVFLVISGGVIPPVLLPGFLQPWVKLSPITWLRGVSAAAGDYEPQSGFVAALAVATLLLMGVGAKLYAHRGNQEVADF